MVGGEGFPGVLTRVFIFGKRPAPSSAHPRLPPPQRELPAPWPSVPAGKEECLQWPSWGKGLGGGKKKFLFLNPHVSFA